MATPSSAPPPLSLLDSPVRRRIVDLLADAAAGDDQARRGRTAAEVAAMPREEMLETLGVPLNPARVKCALLGLGVLKVALHRSRGTPLPAEWAGTDELRLT